MIFMGAVRKVDARYVHAGIRHGGDDLLRLGSGSECADDFCFFHRIAPSKLLRIYFIIIGIKIKGFFEIFQTNCFPYLRDKNLSIERGIKGMGKDLPPF